MPGEPCVISEAQVESSAGRLRVYVATPGVSPVARLLIVHGYGEHAGRYLHFMRWLAERGIASEAIDLRGHGRSAGRRGFVTKWDEYLDDLRSFLERPRSTGLPPVSSPHGESTAGTAVPQRTKSAPPLFVMGHSHGGLIVAIAGERGMLQDYGVAGCILSSPYLATRLVTPWYKILLGKIANQVMPYLGVPTGLRPQMLTSDQSMRNEDAVDALMNRSATPRWYFTMLEKQLQSLKDAPKFHLPLLCLIGADDVIADPTAVAGFFRKAGSVDKSHYVYPTCAHELFRETSREVVFDDVMRWIEARRGAL
jgi:alpha-beta hydrolase superfamily lysophospholipase